jgi:hypothetical protein
VPGLLERVGARRGGTPARPANLSLDDYVELLRFQGFSGEYPLLRTSMGKLDEEQLVQTASMAYRMHGPVFALVLARLQVFSQVRFAWTRFQGGQPSDLFGTTALKVLERPWPGGTTSDLLARMEVDVSTAGTSYVRKITRPRQPPRLGRLRPEWVIVALGSAEDAEHPAEAADVELLGFAYAPPTGNMVLLDPGEVAVFAPIPDPDRIFLGMSWITPVLSELRADSAQTEHKLAFFRNNASPNLAIKFDAAVTVEQVERFKALFEAEHAGALNAYKTLFLGGGADPVPIGSSLKDMDFSSVAGKAEPLALDTPVPTPTGWTTMGEIKPGDVVFGRDGRPTNVVAVGPVHHDRQCYRIVCKQGESVIADALHPWVAVDRNTASRSERIYSTRELYELLNKPYDHHGYRLSLPEAPTLELPEVDLLISPYVLGAWLGDGQTAGAAICGAWDDLKYIAAEIDSRGYTVTRWESSRGATPGRRTDNAVIGLPGGVLAALDALGTLGDKHVPNQYLRASTDQRLDLLRGLMDTDGSVSHTGFRGQGQCSYSSKDERLARQVLELVRSLGYRASITVTADSRSRTGQHWRVRFRSRPDRIPFLLPRKADRCIEAGEQHYTNRRSIISIEPVESTPVRCITVDTEDHLFLAGDGFIPTHNSRLAAAAGVPPSWVGFSEGLQGSALNAGNFNSARRRYADGTAHHWWANAARSLEPLVADPVNAPGASLWFDTRSVPFLREDAADAAKIQAEEAQTIVALVKDGFTPESAIDAVKNRDWGRLRHLGLLSVQLQPPANSDPGAAAVNQARSVVEMVQKVYLGVGVVLSDSEARAILNQGGAGLPPGGLPGAPAAPPNGQGNGKVPAALAR